MKNIDELKTEVKKDAEEIDLKQGLICHQWDNKDIDHFGRNVLKILNYLEHTEEELRKYAALYMNEADNFATLLKMVMKIEDPYPMTKEQMNEKIDNIINNRADFSSL